MKQRYIIPAGLSIALCIAAYVGYWAGRLPVVKPQPLVSAAPVVRRAPALPAPSVVADKSAASAPPAAPAVANPLVEQLLKDVDAKVTMAQPQSYLAQNKRDAESLLIAARLTGDLSLLREAVKRFPQ